jgi:15-cis-phytoene synthase
MELYDTTTFECSKLITQRYSTSFTLGIKTLHKKFHLPIYAIYGFVRYADEIVDTFHNYDKKTLLARFKADTYQAIAEKISLNPVLHSFQIIVNEYKIELDLIEAFLHSMEMDLQFKDYSQSGYQEYIYGSAEVVGLMCLRVFCEGNAEMYESLKASARSLGAAFQKVNFLREAIIKSGGALIFRTLILIILVLMPSKPLKPIFKQILRQPIKALCVCPMGLNWGFIWRIFII